MKRILFASLALLVAFSPLLPTASAQGTAFTYNGRLNDGGTPATGSFDLSFKLCDAVTNGNLIGALTNPATAVNNGLFTVTLDFGSIFSGTNYWLELAARTNGGAVFTILSPRQPITPTPYAIYAANAGYAITAASANSVAAANIYGTLTGNGAGLTNVSLQNANSGGAFDWTTNYGFSYSTNLYNVLAFSPASSPSVGTQPFCIIAVTNLIGDGKVDLVCATYISGTLTVLTNQGNGGFANFGVYTNYAVGLNPISVCAAAINGDGKPDLKCAGGVDEQRERRFQFERHLYRGPEPAFRLHGGCQRGWPPGFDLC